LTFKDLNKFEVKVVINNNRLENLILKDDTMETLQDDVNDGYNSHGKYSFYLQESHLLFIEKKEEIKVGD
jgi:hypothetical protein